VTRSRLVGVLLALTLVPAACSSGNDNAAPAGSTAPTSKATTTTTGHAHGESSGCAKTAVAAGTKDLTIRSGGKVRKYRLIVPKSYDGRKPFGLVLGLHSLTVDYRVVPSITGLADLMDTYHYIGVAPSGLLDGPAPYWNAAPVKDNEDVTFIGDLLDHLEGTLCLDTAKVFSEGMSNGAQLSSLLACRMPERIAAISPIAGVEFNEPCDRAPVPMIAFHGAADPIVPYKGGGLNSVRIAQIDRYGGKRPPGVSDPPGVDESMRLWARHNGCRPKPVETRISDEVRLRTWQGCKAKTLLYIVDGGGHAWPGRPQKTFEAQFGHGTTDIDATKLMFAFFFGGKP
jgi:polyhydroxybutyrate depolymerase